ncbi:type II restriction endonuclease [Aquisalimonas sp. APHAB1-3]|uniref:type II restriction endonuclease n=1 Tax=Aquisalimonas sp. APHAB1-3 TaxID=3402080 RepID=UPI003AB01261
MIESISEIFDIAAGRYLSAVDAEPQVSNQHEIGGLTRVGFREVLGEPGKNEVYRFSCLMAYIPDDDDDPTELVEDTVSWYDSRSRQPHRGPEYRLYYRDNTVTASIREGDLMVIARKRTGELVILFTPQDSSAAAQLQYLFGLPAAMQLRFDRAQMPAQTLSLPLKYLLEEIGVTAIEPEDAEDDLQIVCDRFPDRFPRTAEFSLLAQERQAADPLGDPDATLIAWMEREEALFRAYERHVVAERLRLGFGPDGDDVDEFIAFSLSVQNRRKSRVGHAFENHLAELFRQNGLRFETGGNRRVTENQSKPDFLFPGFREYHDTAFPDDSLFLLGAKTTCKDRWRQVLAEGARIRKKHLATMQTGISEAQTDEMAHNNLQLVIPSPLQPTFTPRQRDALLSLSAFIATVAAAGSPG